METDYPLRILLVEDLPSDAELAERELRKEGILFTSKRVDTKKAFLKALDEFRPDLIISDYAMPTFDGMQALNLALAHDPHLPFIILTGAINEETAVACMKAGATDYIIKDHMKRLPSAVLGAIEQKKVLLEKDKTTEELMAIYENAPLIMMLVDREMRIHKVNGYTAAFTGRSPGAMHLMRCGEALHCLNALTSPEGCGFGEQCEQCLVCRTVTKTFSTGQNHHLVEGSLPYRSDQREEKKTFILSTTKLNIGRECLALVILQDITDRKRAEEELSVSESRFKAVFNQGPLGIALIDSMTGSIHTVNPMFAKIVGRSVEESSDIDWMSITHPDDVRELLDDIALMNTRKIDGFRKQIRYLRPDDSSVWINIAVAPLTVEDHLYPLHLCMIEDCTEHKKTVESLQLSEDNFRRSLEDSPLGIRIVSDEGEIVYANRALLDMFGYGSIEELREISVAKRYTESSYAEFMDRQEKRRLLVDDSSEYEIDIVRKDGTVRYLQVLRKRSRWNKKEHYQVIYRDITKRKIAEESLAKTTERLRRMLAGTVQAISMAVEVKDPYTAGHQRRTADLSRAIATEMGFTADRTDFVRIASTIHDIGKIAVPAEILSKPTKLSEIEFSLIKTHSQAAYDILGDIEFPWPVAEVILQHHERMDGSGYPRGLKGDNILPEARLMAVADVVEAMASHRPYRPKLGLDAAIEEISKNRGVLYDSEMVDACLVLLREKGYRLI